ncbi:MAG: hypothetical protein GF341_01410 [candidate division Zixibacteria bacterium]|nr:hypothetical protein [candidate division Zixibacteria bacterium]
MTPPWGLCLLTTRHDLDNGLEDCLQTILNVLSEKETVWRKDLTARMKTGCSSLACALKRLDEQGLIECEPRKPIRLTAKGRVLAEGVARRHESLRGFFSRALALETALADEAVSRIEKALPRDVLTRFQSFVEIVEADISGDPPELEFKNLSL